MQNKKLLIGVTGGIGSGKSLACKYFLEPGGEIFHADEITKGLYHSNPKLKKELVKTFGEKILDEKKQVSFPKFREIVFSSEANQKRVNKIVHPFVIRELLELTKNSKSKLIFIEAALIFESGFDKYLDYTIEIFAPVKKRIEWVRKRNQLTISQIRSIMKLQMPEKEKLQKADFVIRNISSIHELRKKAEFIYKLIYNLIE